MKILGRNSKLSAMLEDTCRRVSALDPSTEGAAMVGQILRSRPDIEQKMNSAANTTAGKTAKDIILKALGLYAVSQVKNLPAQVNILVERINDRSTEPALRCALVSVLAYVSQLQDLVPDDALGGYGFVDDCAMLSVTMLQLLEPTAANANKIEEGQKTLASFQSLLPENVSSAIQLAIQGVVLLFQSTRMLPAHVADMMTQQILDNPEGVTPPQAPPNFQMPNLSPPGAGHWSGGAYFEGGNVVMPGGPSLIDGQLYIPD